jgi:3'-phosphoadenosine 5'-phosphosulfate sulfotransferase (PAPS reductase)/FAD synthetase
MSKPLYLVVSLSGGKDSTAMLLGMIERGMQIDCILFCDTGLEFPDMYKHLDKLEQDIRRPITRVHCEYSYEYLMFETPVNRKHNTAFAEKYGLIHKGYGWAGTANAMVYVPSEGNAEGAIPPPLREKYDVLQVCRHRRDEQYRVA